MYKENEDEIEETQKKKKFNIFDWYYRQGKIDEKNDINYLENPNIINFFKLLGKKLGKLFSANLLFVFGNIPLLFVIIALSGIFGETSVAPLNQQWGIIKGITIFEEGTVINPLMPMYNALYGAKTSINVITNTSIIFFILGALIIFTWGFTKVGTTYIYRNLILGEPVFPLSDFVYIIRKNIKQSLLFGFIDVVFIAMFIYNIYFLFSNYSINQMNSIMLFFTICMAIIYSFIRPYAYIMIFTFDLPAKKIIKNSLLFTVLGIKRNLIGLLASLILIILNVCIFILYIPIGIILPFIITIAILDFIGVYVAYPNIDKYMVDHSPLNNNDNDFNEESTEETE